MITDYDPIGGTDVVIPATATNATITYDVTIIGYEAFMSNNLTSVSIPNSVTDIENRAFIWNDLTTVDIPNSVVNIKQASFGSNQIANVTFGTNLISIGENAFNGNQLTSFTLPTGVTDLEKQVFANNMIADVVIPDGITSIGDGVFSGNPMTSVTSFSVTPPTITTALGVADTFAEDRSNIDLFIPLGTAGPYVTDLGALWTGFKSVTEAALGIENTALNNKVKIYPNPVISQFSIDSEEVIEKVTIVTSMGRVVESIVTPNSTLDVAHLSTGVYYLQIQTEKGLINQKLVKE
jgi:hypothetical protein